MTTYEIKHDDVIDSRDLIELAKEIREDEDHTREDLELATEIEELGEEAGTDWEYGETLIAENYFEDYAQEMADQCGLIPDDLAWPLTCIDWEWAAKELAYDYSLYTLDGRDYFIRSC